MGGFPDLRYLPEVWKMEAFTIRGPGGDPFGDSSRAIEGSLHGVYGGGLMTKKGEGNLTTLWNSLVDAKKRIQELEKKQIPKGKWVPIDCMRCEEPTCEGCKFEDKVIEGDA